MPSDRLIFFQVLATSTFIVRFDKHPSYVDKALNKPVNSNYLYLYIHICMYFFNYHLFRMRFYAFFSFFTLFIIIFCIYYFFFHLLKFFFYLLFFIIIIIFILKIFFFHLLFQLLIYHLFVQFLTLIYYDKFYRKPRRLPNDSRQITLLTHFAYLINVCLLFFYFIASIKMQSPPITHLHINSCAFVCGNPLALIEIKARSIIYYIVQQSIDIHNRLVYTHIHISIYIYVFIYMQL